MLSVAIMIVGAFGAFAQQPQMQPVPLTPAVKHGTLPNGLQYFIMHNEEPKERANFYIAQKVGSTLETSEQLGLAHFLEHMAFNGTSHYPGKNMLNYLQSKGIRFGADINAYTAFDETVYNINNVPTTDKALMDSVLLAIHDWSGEILLEEDEINAERGVIEEEWRSRNDANSRMLEYILPKVYKEYQYQQTPIGKMEVVRNFPPEVLRAYYKKWYRPDQQGIIIVGDFDADEMEKKVIDLFSPIPMPENAAERTYPTVSDNKEPIFVVFEDPEGQFTRLTLSFKTEKTPFEMRNTLAGYVQDQLLESILSSLINNRLTEYNQKPECKYAYAGVHFGDFWVSKTKAAFTITVVGKTDIKEGFAEAMGIIARACKTGFTDSELQRVYDSMTARYEKLYNERNKTTNGAYANELIRHFVDNEAAPGIEMEFELVKQLLPNIPVMAINQVAATILTPENQVIVIDQPKKEGIAPASEKEMLSTLENALNAEYEAYVDEVITDPLIEKLPKPGKIKAQSEGKFGTTELLLSNGVRVIVKPTDFKADEIRFTAFRNGGKRSYPESQAANVLLMEDAFSASKIGNFDNVKLRKYLSGKVASLSYSVGNTVNSFDGSSSVKDLPTLMELIYAGFTSVNPDPETFNAQIDQARSILKNADSNPNFVFSKHLASAQYGNNPMFQEVDVNTLDAANYNEILDMIRLSTANAADYTFVFVGNVDIETLKPLLEQYVATLPAKKGKSVVKDLSPITIASGQVIDNFKQPMHSPKSQVYAIFSGTNVPYSIENSVKLSTIGQILRMVFTETLREEMGGTYSPAAGAVLNPYTGQWMVIYTYETNAEMLGKMEERANAEFLKLLNDGAKEVDFNKVKEATMKQYEMNVRNNGYWENNLVMLEKGFDDISGHKAAIENLTLQELNKFMKNLYNGKNRIEVIMEGIESK